MDLGDLLGGIDTKNINQVIKLVTDHKDLIAKLDDLPELFERVGGALAAAGGEAKEAAVALVGSDAESGIKGTLADAAEALGDIATALAKGVELLSDGVEAIAKVPLMDGPAKKLTTATTQIGSTTERLSALSQSMTSISETLGKVASSIEKLGDHLDQSGAQAKGFLGT